MTATTAPTDSLRAHQVVVPPTHRRHRRDVIRWALANGRRVHRDALAALIGARADSLPGSAVDEAAVDGAAVWSAPDVGALLWVGVADWCAEHGAELPGAEDVSATLGTYLRYLSAHRRLATGSDPVAALRRAVTEYGGTGRRSSDHPSMRRRPAPVLPLA
jgi:hypothetical protein